MLFSTSRPLRDALNLRIARALAGLVVLVLAPTAVAYDWLQFNFDVQRSGNNTLERTIHRNNVGQLVLKWQVNLGGNPDGSPVLLDNVSTAAGITAVVYVSTRQGTLIAVDTRNGTVLWSKSYPANGCTHGGSACDMATTPAIDPNRQYIYNYGLDGYVHKYQVGDGTEVVTGGWPQQTTLKGFNEKHGGGLAIATSGGQTYLYVVHGGYPGDAGDYQGHITTINLATGTQKVFNAACSNLTVHIPPQPGTPLCNSVQTAVWARPGVVYDPRVDRVFFATGNANSKNTGVNGGFDWSESVLSINPDGSGASGKPVDSYTPTNADALDNADADIGSTAPVLLATPPGSSVPQFAMQGGKDAMLRLVNLANLSGQGGPGHSGGEWSLIGIPQGGGLLQQPAAWVNLEDNSTWTFVGNNSGMSALKIGLDAQGVPFLVTPRQWQVGGAWGSPVIANNVLFATGGSVRAFDPLTGATLWSTPRAGGGHFHAPIVANGEVYVTDSSNRLSAFALAGASGSVDIHTATGTSSNVNGMIEPGERVLVEATRLNRSATGGTLGGVAGTLTGPAGATYTVNSTTASFGTVASGAASNCFTATGTCYQISVSNPATRPALNWVVTLSENLTNPGGTDPILTRLHVGGSFPDVPITHIMYRFVETVLHNAITIGFGDGTYHPDDTSTRAQTAILVARSTVVPNGDSGIAFGGSVVSPPGNYSCVAGGSSLFSDILPTDVGCKQIHLLAATGVNLAFECATPGGMCPTGDTSRAAMAVLVAGTMAGGDVNVPMIGTFSDTGSPRSYNCTAGGSSHFPDVAPSYAACRHINYLWARGKVDGYLDGSYQPATLVSRSQMAKFMTNGFGLTLY